MFDLNNRKLKKRKRSPKKKKKDHKAQVDMMKDEIDFNNGAVLASASQSV